MKFNEQTVRRRVKNLRLRQVHLGKHNQKRLDIEIEVFDFDVPHFLL